MRPAPRFFKGANVALFGGSFDPPHSGHQLVAKAALKTLDIDYLWWLVSPQNPLKSHRPQTTDARLKAVRQMTKHMAGARRFIVSDEESRLGTQYAIDTVRALKAVHPHVNFIWLIGADNLAQMHRWKDWQQLMREIPLAVYPRPMSSHRAGLAPAAQAFAWARLPSHTASQLKYYQAPAWVMLSGAQSTLASSELRQMGD